MKRLLILFVAAVMAAGAMAEENDLSAKVFQKGYSDVKIVFTNHSDTTIKSAEIRLFYYDEQGNPLKHRWEMVSSHTARRSCITNMYLSGKFTVPQMMSVSGHKTERIFYKYVKLSLDEYADEVAFAANDGLF